MNLHHINTIARYEVKLLRRGWLFRIFAVLILFFLTVYQLQLFTNIFWKYNEVWSHVGVSSLIPYITHYLYVVAQSGIVIFLAGNFIKRDKKLDTAEVIYVRPMSNFDYIVGKVWGIVRTFLGLNVLVLLVAMFINVVLSRSPFNPVFYLTYLLTISLPSLLFILGLSFAAMSLFRNQAVTFIVMLGLMAIVFFFLKDRLYGIFDFFGSDIPSVFSDVTGHANLRLYLWQRSVYLLLAIGLLLLTISFLHRLPLRPWKGKLLGGIALLFIVWGFATGWGYVHSFQNRIDKREEYRAIYNRHAGLSQTRVLTNDLIIKQSGNNLDVVSRLTLKNENRIQAIQPVILYLNPELKIMSIMNEGCNVPFVREKQVIRIDSLPLHSGDLTLSLYYSGTLDEDICYLDLEDNEYFKKSELSDFYYGKKYLYLQREFTLLTPECLWYPVSEPPVYPAIPYAVGKNFTRYTLKYINSRNKTVISQGHCELVADTVKYSNKTPLPGISLTVGDYEKKAIRVDSTDYELYTFKDHDFFSQSFDQIGDTLPALIRATRNEIEATKNREYLFSKFAMVETPIHFTGYVRNWKGYSEQVMPEIVFLPERGVNTMADFKANYLRVRDWRRQESVMEDNEIQAQMLRDYIRITFIDEESSEGAAPWSHTPQLNKWNIGAMFFGHVGFLTSVEYPIADVVLNTMQNVKESTVKPIWWGMTNALDDKSRANIYLDGHSFKDAVEDRSMKSQVFYELLKLKSFYLRNYITTKITEDQLKTFLKTFSEKSTFE
ncbi:ABC transporter permease, partial [Porphyromonadaceae bacterium OttesenSCG-928-L07]|nr:ABC transporter permease [Porphyromonadaceae bacterium OttesenSCG-928-L07]